VLLMAQMVIAPPSTAMANAKASKNFVIMMLPRFDPAICGSTWLGPGYGADAVL
jgi:hypothetical protein